MNRRSFFKGVAGAIAGVFMLSKKVQAKRKPNGRVCVSVFYTFDTKGNLLVYKGVKTQLRCPKCLGNIAEIEEGGPWPPTMYCPNCDVGFVRGKECTVYSSKPIRKLSKSELRNDKVELQGGVEVEYWIYPPLQYQQVKDERNCYELVRTIEDDPVSEDDGKLIYGDP